MFHRHLRDQNPFDYDAWLEEERQREEEEEQRRQDELNAQIDEIVVVGIRTESGPTEEKEEEECIKSVEEEGEKCVDTFLTAGTAMCEYTTSAGIGFVGSLIKSGFGFLFGYVADNTQEHANNPVCDYLDNTAKAWCAQQVEKKIDSQCKK